MGRSNYAILVLGLGSMIAMSLLMGYFLKATKEKQSPIATELQASFGHRLDEDSKVVLDGPETARRCRVTIHPILGGSHERLAKEVGEFVWRRFSDQHSIEKVVVACVRWGIDKQTEYEVPRPYMPGHPTQKTDQQARPPARPAGRR